MMADLLVYLLRFKEGDRRHRNLLKMYTIYIYIYLNRISYSNLGIIMENLKELNTVAE